MTLLLVKEKDRALFMIQLSTKQVIDRLAKWVWVLVWIRPQINATLYLIGIVSPRPIWRVLSIHRSIECMILVVVVGVLGLNFISLHLRQLKWTRDESEILQLDEMGSKTKGKRIGNE